MNNQISDSKRNGQTLLNSSLLFLPLTETNKLGKITDKEKKIIYYASKLSSNLTVALFTDALSDTNSLLEEIEKIGAAEVCFASVGNLNLVNYGSKNSSEVSDVDGAEIFGHIPVLTSVQADFLAQLAESKHPEVVVLPTGYSGTEIASMVGMWIDVAMITNVYGISATENGVSFSKTVLSGSWDTSVVSQGGRAVITIEPQDEQCEENGKTDCQLEKINYQPKFIQLPVEVLEYQPDKGDEVSLVNAKVVVCGGRGVEGDFTLVKRLAAVLGGAVGATRVATDEGWIDHAAQIGQTGVTVSPELYIGLGVSGQIHHTVGMQTAKKIVAVVNDPEAPICELADLTIIGDIQDVVPQAIEELGR